MQRTFGRLVILAALLAAAGCHRADSILLVEVAGDLRLTPAQLQVAITVEGQTRALMVPPAPTAIALPASFSVELDRNLTGPVMVHVDAYDASGTFLGSGDTTQEHINVGDDTIIVVTIASTMPPPDDGGAAD